MTEKKYTVVSEAGSIGTGGSSHHSGDIDSRVTVFRVKAPEGWTETIVAVESRYYGDNSRWDWTPEYIISVQPDARYSRVEVEVGGDDSRVEAIIEAVAAFRAAASEEAVKATAAS